MMNAHMCNFMDELGVQNNNRNNLLPQIPPVA